MFEPTSPENAADIETLTGLFSACPIGQTVTYSAMDDALGRSARDRQWLINKARQQAEERTGNLFEVVRGEGMKRLPSHDVAGVGLANLRKIRRAAKRAIERLGTVRTNDLGEDEQRKLIAHKSQLGAISLVADGRKSQALVGEVAGTGQVVPAGRVLEMFR
jgi:hypothetical protein